MFSLLAKLRRHKIWFSRQAFSKSSEIVDRTSFTANSFLSESRLHFLTVP